MSSNPEPTTVPLGGFERGQKIWVCGELLDVFYAHDPHLYVEVGDGRVMVSPTQTTPGFKQQRQNLARSIKKRMEALYLKGKRRDDAALDYACGYAQALHLTLGEDLSSLVFLLAVRGYEEVERWLQD